MHRNTDKDRDEKVHSHRKVLLRDPHMKVLDPVEVPVWGLTWNIFWFIGFLFFQENFSCYKKCWKYWNISQMQKPVGFPRFSETLGSMPISMLEIGVVMFLRTLQWCDNMIIEQSNTFTVPAKITHSLFLPK